MIPGAATPYTPDTHGLEGWAMRTLIDGIKLALDDYIAAAGDTIG
jgi:hypothetical protein